MKDKKTICLLNDSFPPQIDGVANTVLNYAKHIESDLYKPVVITPAYPKAADEEYSFPVIRYPSVNFKQREEYMVGIPFSPKAVRQLSEENISLLHSHCPIVSTLMARELRQIVDAPIILTYHTKFNIDIANIIKNTRIQAMCNKLLGENISACDEVWTVSRGAGENLRELGYEGEYIVMPNGVDLPKGRVSKELIEKAVSGYDIPADVPCYLFVGRMMWYKGIKLILDALSKLSLNGKDYRMVFVGEGDERAEMVEYAKKAGIEDRCIFAGAIRDREILRAWYCRCDLFLFPSTYDTNGLVVREAAACSLPSVMIKDSCAAEEIFDGRNGFLIDETAESLYECLMMLYDRKDKLREVGECAGNEIYISWKDAVVRAMQRYETVMERHKEGLYVRARGSKPKEGFMKLNGELMEALALIFNKRKNRK